jgi:hypothetical protein
VLERHPGYCGAVITVTHQPDEARQRTDRGIAAHERLGFGTRVEVFALNRNLQFSLP